MDTPPQTIVGIRTEVRSAAYRATLRTYPGCCFGFLLGNAEPFEAPSFEFSLISHVSTTEDDILQAPQIFQAQLPICERVAAHTGCRPMGIFLAWNTDFVEHRNQVLGLIVDTAREMDLQYVIIFPTMGYETFWAAQVYFAGRFPHDALSYRILRGKLSLEPRHNPRRVRALWNSLIRETQHAAPDTKADGSDVIH